MLPVAPADVDVLPDAYPGRRHDDGAAMGAAVRSTAADVLAAANAQTTCDPPGYCLRAVRGWLGIESRELTAIDAWEAADHRHPDDPAPPPAAPMFWRGGSEGNGHVALSRFIDMRSTDVPTAGRVGNDPGSWPVAVWGMTYLGWSEDLNGVSIPYLADAGGWRAGGDVYVDKLHFGQLESDSVARLRYRLTNHPGLVGSGHRPGYGHSYGDECRDAVRWWSLNVCPASVPGPRDGSAVSDRQAARLFGPRYTVHPAA
jgi:hypothetical protein